MLDFLDKTSKTSKVALKVHVNQFITLLFNWKFIVNEPDNDSF